MYSVILISFYLLSDVRQTTFLQIDSMLLCICSVVDHRRCLNVVRTSVTHLAIAMCATFLFLPYFDVMCDQLLNTDAQQQGIFFLIKIK